MMLMRPLHRQAKTNLLPVGAGSINRYYPESLSNKESVPEDVTLSQRMTDWLRTWVQAVRKTNKTTYGFFRKMPFLNSTLKERLLRYGLNSLRRDFSFSAKEKHR